MAVNPHGRPPELRLWHMGISRVFGKILMWMDSAANFFD
jgi:hypothetical protein